MKHDSGLDSRIDDSLNQLPHNFHESSASDICLAFGNEREQSTSAPGAICLCSNNVAQVQAVDSNDANLAPCNCPQGTPLSSVALTGLQTCRCGGERRLSGSLLPVGLHQQPVLAARVKGLRPELESPMCAAPQSHSTPSLDPVARASSVAMPTLGNVPCPCGSAWPLSSLKHCPISAAAVSACLLQSPFKICWMTFVRSLSSLRLQCGSCRRLVHVSNKCRDSAHIHCCRRRGAAEGKGRSALAFAALNER